MISPPRTVIGIGAAAAAALAYGAFTHRRSSLVGVATLGGLAGLVGACLAWQAADDEDGELKQHPALMNGYFLTNGEASALSDDPADVPRLAGLMGVPMKRGGGRRRGNQVR
jgi:hypothetical protein